MHIRRVRRQLFSMIFVALAFGAIGGQDTKVVKGFSSQTGINQSDEQLKIQKGREVIGQACIQCHNLRSTEMQRKSAQQWRETIYSMISRGAQVMPDEIEPLTAYLTANFGPNSPPVTKAGAGSSGNISIPSTFEERLPDGQGKTILLRSCIQCHTLGLVVNSSKSEEEWNETLNRMIALGVVLTAEEQQTLTEYLAKNFGAK